MNTRKIWIIVVILALVGVALIYFYATTGPVPSHQQTSPTNLTPSSY